MANDLFKKLMSFQDTRPPVPLMDPNAEDEPKQEDFEVASPEPIELGAMPNPDLERREAILNSFKSFKPTATSQAPTEESELERHLASMDKADADRVDQEIASADFDQQAMTGSPEVQEDVMSSMSPREKVLSDFQRLKLAQEAHQGNLGNLAMLQGANTIAQGFALGRGAKIGNNAEGIAALEKASGQAPKDIMDQMKLGGTDMNDPQSDISRFARAQAARVMATRGGKLDPELEQKYNEEFSQMSAAQLEKLGFKNIVGGSSAKTNNRYVTIQEPDGTVRSKVVNMDTGEVVKDLGLAGYAYGINVDPVTGQLMRSSKSDPNQAFNKPPQQQYNQVPEDKETGQKKAQNVGDYRAMQTILPKEWDNIITKDKEGFERQNADKLKIMSGLKGIEALVDEAVTNPNAAASLGGIIGSLFEPGKLTDEDAKRYVQEAGLVNKYGNIITKGITGTIPKDLATNIKATAKAYQTQLDKIVRTNAKKYASASKNALINGRDVDENILTDFYYQPDAAPGSDASGEVKRKTADGKIAIFDAKTKKFLRYEGEK